MGISSGVALLIDFFATFLCQSGYVLQKKGHVSVESHNTASETENKLSGFTTWIWFMGFLVATLAGVMHAVVTPFADIVLLSFNSATAIVIHELLAIIFLKEVFICKYDLPANALIILGSVCIILTANFDEHIATVAVHKKNLSDIRSVCFYIGMAVLFYLTVCLLRRMRRNLATFERETDLWLLSKSEPTITE